jgi:2-amino-4-hydroxy-6-hydroxymethyldihydropteridine diphosphokinase
MVEAYIGLGSNRGDRFAALASARRALAGSGEILLAISPVYDTEPWGPVRQDNYLNQVAKIATARSARALLERMRAIETEHGRDRSSEVRFGPRRLDLDLLLYGNDAIAEPDLVVPHPRMIERAFVLRPLLDLAPDLVVGGTRIADALGRLDERGIRRYDPI